MTYAQDEASRESGSPIELYEFVGTIETFRYTNHTENYSFMANTFVSVPMERSELVVNSGGGIPELTLSVPITLNLISKYVFQIAPQDLTLTVYRVHVDTGNSSTYWEGPVAAFSVKERLVRIRCPSPLGLLMEDKLPNVRYQPQCNNVLYDFVCGIIDSDFRESGTISTVSGDGKSLTLSTAGLPSRPNQWARGGEIVNQTTGESRMILDQVGNAIDILWPFSADTGASDAIYVYAGCDHSISTCRSKFNNVNNFNGMPNVVTQKIASEQDSE